MHGKDSVGTSRACESSQREARNAIKAVCQLSLEFPYHHQRTTDGSYNGHTPQII